MITEEDSKRILEAKNCNDCLEWHKYCKAECCKIVLLHVDLETVKKATEFVDLMVSPRLNLNEIQYYLWRDVSYIRNRFLRFKKSRIITVGRKVLYIHPCSQLRGNLCVGHKTGAKPIICKALTKETARLPNQGFIVTDNCLFKYKLMGDSLNE